MEKVEFLRGEVEGKGEAVSGLERQVAELKEENRDLGIFISSGERIRELGGGEDVRLGTVEVKGPVGGAAAGGGDGADGEGAGAGKGKNKNRRRKK